MGWHSRKHSWIWAGEGWGKQQSLVYHVIQNKEHMGIKASREPMGDGINNLFEDLEDETYDLLAWYYDQLANGIRSAVLDV